MAQDTVRYGPESDVPQFSCLAIIVGPNYEIPLVMEDRPNAFWKLPGGRNKGTESPRQAIVREIHEETGLKINQNDLIEFEKIEHAAHDQYVFAILVSSFKGLRELGQENGTKSLTIKLFPARKILQEDLLPPHRKVLERSRPGLDKLGAAI